MINVSVYPEAVPEEADVVMFRTKEDHEKHQQACLNKVVIVTLHPQKWLEHIQQIQGVICEDTRTEDQGCDRPSVAGDEGLGSGS